MTAEYEFLPNIHRTFTKTEHMLGYKTSVQNFKEFQGSDSEILHSVWAKNKYCMTSCMGGSQSSQIQRDRK